MGFLIDPTRSTRVVADHLGIDVDAGSLEAGRTLLISSDFYTVYQSLAGVEEVHPLWCWAHIRRYFIRAADAHKALRPWGRRVAGAHKGALCRPSGALRGRGEKRRPRPSAGDFASAAALRTRELLGLLGALGCAVRAWASAPRDAHIGWDAPTRKQRLHLVVGNSRFLIIPHVRAQKLA